MLRHPHLALLTNTLSCFLKLFKLSQFLTHALMCTFAIPRAFPYFRRAVQDSSMLLPRPTTEAIRVFLISDVKIKKGVVARLQEMTNVNISQAFNKHISSGANETQLPLKVSRGIQDSSRDLRLFSGLVFLHFWHAPPVHKPSPAPH